MPSSPDGMWTCELLMILVHTSDRMCWTQRKFDMFRHDRIRLQHMLDAAREAISFARDRTRNDLDMDRQLVLSLVKDIEIVGEAAARITESTRQQTSEIPWEEIVAMRNRLVHGYFDIDLNVVWQTVQIDLPTLIAQLEHALLSESDS